MTAVNDEYNRLVLDRVKSFPTKSHFYVAI